MSLGLAQIDLTQPAVVFSNMLTIWSCMLLIRRLMWLVGLSRLLARRWVFFFSSMGLRISSSKSEVMLVSRKHERPSILIRIGSHILPQTTTFKYLGVFFDCGLRWSTQTKYVMRICLQRINLLKSVAGVSWGSIYLVCFCSIGVSLALFWNTLQFATQEWPRHICYCLNAFSIEH
jgi:hypothetical protein